MSIANLCIGLSQPKHPTQHFRHKGLYKKSFTSKEAIDCRSLHCIKINTCYANATSERTFSAVRRVKTYLRSTTRQDRLNHLMILHVHKDRTDALDLKEVANEFVSGSEHRLRIFGKF